MRLSHKFVKIRSKPRHVREGILVISLLFVATCIILIWVATFSVDAPPKITSPVDVDNLKKSFSNTMNSAKDRGLSLYPLATSTDSQW